MTTVLTTQIIPAGVEMLHKPKTLTKPQCVAHAVAAQQVVVMMAIVMVAMVLLIQSKSFSNNVTHL
jgi:hypothetical protein